MRRLLFVLTLLSLSSCDCSVDPLAPVPGRVAGLICDENTGLPVADRHVALHSQATTEVQETDTDAGGNYLIDRVPAGPATLVVGSGDDERTLEVFVGTDSTTSVSDPACRDVPPGPGFGDIIGVICNRHVGALVQNAVVQVALADDEIMQTTTDDDGAFQLFNVPVGPRVVTVTAEGFTRSWAVDVIEGTFIEIPSDDECTSPDASEGMLSGVFCDPQTAGVLSGALVTVTDAEGSVHEELTDTEGAFLLGPMVPGLALVHVTKDALVLDLTAVIVAGEESQVTNGGGCVVEQCSATDVTTDADGRIELVLVVDRSGSMTSGAPGYPGTRWEGVSDAITAVTAQLQTRVAFGLAVFPSLDSAECGTASLVVEPTFDNAPQIADVLDDFYTEPLGATPTAAALQEVRAWHTDHPPTLPRAVLLATDGGPNCNATLDPSTCACSSGVDTSDCATSFEPLLCLDDDNAISAVQALRAQGLDTYVIGIPGVENFGDVLDAMAQAGGTNRYYLARDTGTLEAAVGDIGRRAGGCSIEVNADDVGDLSRAARLEVAIDGAPIEADPLHEDGFAVVDATHVELYGAACEAWLTAGTMSLGVCTIEGSTP
jgi:hypothetical protein